MTTTTSKGPRRGIRQDNIVFLPWCVSAGPASANTKAYCLR